MVERFIASRGFRVQITQNQNKRKKEEKVGNVQRLQNGLKTIWTDELYSKQFRDSPSKYRDFDHALKHVRKAAQALENMTEEADHGRIGFSHGEIRKYVADIVISAVRLANVSPTESFDLEGAIFERIERKMGAHLERESDVEEKRLNEKLVALRQALWDNVRVWNDPSDRNYFMCGICSATEFEGHRAPCPLV